ncbi:MAG: lamin tail domain-containing protein, partial [Gemmatimonadaceae bacterium]|nr:lamin tail domain-containing protein [Gemmatimonadaceae bacterium]
MAVRINEIESNGGVPGDWIEFFNAGTTPQDLAGYVVRDNNDAAGYTLPAGTIIAANSYLVVDEAQFGFGLGAADAARLFAPGGTTLVDSYVWTAHAATTYGRCPNGSGPFVTTTASTKGAANNCPGDLVFAAWPGEQSIATADAGGVFGGNMSGLFYQPLQGLPTGVVWAVRNGPGTLFRLT